VVACGCFALVLGGLCGAQEPADESSPAQNAPTASGDDAARDPPADTLGRRAGEASDPPPSVVPPPPPRETLELSIEEAVRIALARNFQVRIADIDLRMRERDLVIERAVFDPYLTLGTFYSKNRRPTASFLDLGGGAVTPEVQVNPFETTSYNGGIRGRTLIGTDYTLTVGSNGFDRPLASALFGLNPQESASARLDITQPLLRGAWYPYNSAAIRIAHNNERLAREDLETATSELIYQVESAYWNHAFATQNFAAKTNSLRVAELDLEKARKEERAGTKARIYVTTVRGQLALRQVNYNDARLLVENSRDALLELLNHGGDSLKERWQSGEDVGPFDDIVVVPTSAADLEPFSPDRDVSLAMAFRSRADYRRFAIQLDSQQIAVDTARNDLWPRVDLTTSWEQLGLDDSVEGSFSSLGTGEFYSWSVGVQVEVPLSNRGPKNAFRRAEDRLRQLTWERLQIENRIVLDVDQAIRQLDSLARKVDYLGEVVRLKAEELDAERKKLDAGTSIPFQVHTIENDLIELEAQALQSRTDYLTARAAYYRATGVLLERHDVTLEK